MPVAVVLHSQAGVELFHLFPGLPRSQPVSFQCLEGDLQETAAGLIVSAEATMTATATGAVGKINGRVLIPWRLVSCCFHYQSSDDVPTRSEQRPIGFRPPEKDNAEVASSS